MTFSRALAKMLKTRNRGASVLIVGSIFSRDSVVNFTFVLTSRRIRNGGLLASSIITVDGPTDPAYSVFWGISHPS